MRAAPAGAARSRTEPAAARAVRPGCLQVAGPVRWPLAATLLAGGLLAACSTAGYYGQALHGGVQVLWRRRPVAALLADPATPAPLATRLALARDIRDFASAALALPDNASYRSYAALGRPYAVWNVVAAPEFSLAPLTWCFPIAGCVSYRGYFSPARAHRFAARLAARGHDVDVGGVAAYSTLGWFADPLLDTFLDWPEPDLAGLIFHELAHQRLYVRGDTTFNESFATVVELAGVERWLAHRGDAAAAAAFRRDKERQRQANDLLLAARARLAALYASAASAAEMREGKRAAFDRLRGDLAASGGGESRFAGLLQGDLDNADLAAVGAYHELLPGFERLLAAAGADLPRFYDEAERLGRAGAEERRRALRP